MANLPYASMLIEVEDGVGDFPLGQRTENMHVPQSADALALHPGRTTRSLHCGSAAPLDW